VRVILRFGESESSSKYEIISGAADPAISEILAAVKLITAEKLTFLDQDQFYLVHATERYELQSSQHCSDYRISDGDSILLALKPLDGKHKKQMRIK